MSKQSALTKHNITQYVQQKPLRNLVGCAETKYHTKNLQKTSGSKHSDSREMKATPTTPTVRVACQGLPQLYNILRD